MKKLLLLLTLSFAVVFTSCGPKNEPQAVADAYMKAMFVNFDMDKCMEYVSAEMKADYLEMKNGSDKEQFESLQKLMKDTFKNMELEYKNNPDAFEVDGEWAYVEYTLTSKTMPQVNEEMGIELEMEDGKWVVSDVDGMDMF